MIRQRWRGASAGQSTVEFALSSVVLLLLVAGLLDLSRVYYQDVGIIGAAREGARHGVWFDTPNRRNPYLQDDLILSAVSDNLAGSGFGRVTVNSSIGAGGCPTPADGNSARNPPFASGLYPNGVNQPLVYLCYTPPSPANPGCSISGSPLGSLLVAPTNNCWRLGDLEVIVLLRYGLVTPILQSVVGNGFPVAASAHMQIQGHP